MKKINDLSHFTVISANLTKLLCELSTSGVVLHHVSRHDELTASFYIHQTHVHVAKDIISRTGGEIKASEQASLVMIIKTFLQRPVLIGGMILVLFLTIFLPGRVLFVTVAGNDQLSQKQILDAAAQCGVSFGTPRRELRSEKVKNRLLTAIPSLKWVGINTRGCVAQISVRERSMAELQPERPLVSNLVASHDGVIREMTVRKGNPLCSVGQAVQQGMLLVSGYSDCGRCIYGTNAEAEIYAQTRRSFDQKILTEGVSRGDQRGSHRKIGLIIGKKRINFFKGSGISGITCVRMYKEYPLTLPGGYQLPLALTCQETVEYDTNPFHANTQNAEMMMTQYARDYLQSQMVAGKVLEEIHQLTEMDGALYMTGQYICDEMIGQTRNEEIVYYHE